MDDERLDFLVKHLRAKQARGPAVFGGFAHCIIMEGELLAALDELLRYRERPSTLSGL